MDEICVIQNFSKTDDSSNYSLGQWVQWQRIWQQKLVLLDAEHAIETGFFVKLRNLSDVLQNVIRIFITISLSFFFHKIQTSVLYFFQKHNFLTGKGKWISVW